MTIQTLEEKVQKTATQTANTVKDWTGGVAARASSVLDEAKTAVGDAGAFIEDAARQAGSQATEIGEQAYAKGERVADSVARWVEEQPLTALLVAGAIGVAIGYLLARR